MDLEIFISLYFLIFAVKYIKPALKMCAESREIERKS